MDSGGVVQARKIVIRTRGDVHILGTVTAAAQITREIAASHWETEAWNPVLCSTGCEHAMLGDGYCDVACDTVAW